MKLFFLVLLLLVVVVVSGCTSASGQRLENSLIAGAKVIVFKSPTCGCCGAYVKYLEKNGVQVDVVDGERQMREIKAKYGVPASLESCHTTLVGDYFVEGHIPVEAVEKLLSEKPAIKGIALPGMPSASPGMPGSKTGPFVIYAVSKDNTTAEFVRI